MATITIIGNLTREPELRFTPAGQAVAHFSVAENRRYQASGSQEWTEATSFFHCAAWGDLAEHTAQSLAKGDRVTVTGRIETRSWENDQGEKRSKLEVTATDVSASLRFATVTVSKAERKGSDEDSQS